MEGSKAGVVVLRLEDEEVGMTSLLVTKSSDTVTLPNYLTVKESRVLLLLPRQQIIS